MIFRLSGRERLVAPLTSGKGRKGALIVIPEARHSLEALSAVGDTARRQPRMSLTSGTDHAVAVREAGVPTVGAWIAAGLHRGTQCGSGLQPASSIVRLVVAQPQTPHPGGLRGDDV